MPQYVITPWKFHTELVQVRREIYQLGDSNVDLRRHAIDWIAAWKQRGALPHAVESTALLVDAILHHDATINSSFSIRATYSAAFCRFVTGFCDIGQQGKFKQSMFEVARDLDMPASFVELRHEATHEDLPSLQRLMRNSKLALDWLWQYYWAKLDDPSGAKSKRIANNERPAEEAVEKDQLRVILASFSSKRRVEIKTASTDLSASSASGIACLELVKLCRGSKGALSKLCSLLLEEKMLIPSARKLNSPMNGAFLLYSNLLRRLVLHVPSFASLLTTTMTTTLTAPSALDVSLDAFREAVALWLLHIYVGGPLWRQECIKGKLDQCKGFVVGECVSAPNAWTVKVAKGLTTGKGVDEEFTVQWKMLVDAAARSVDEMG